MNDTNRESEWQDLVTDVDGFWNEETQKNVKGKLVSITEMLLARRPTEVAIVVLTEPCTALKGSKEDKEEVKLEAGQSIGVVIKHKLQDLRSMVDNQCMVDITAKDKIDLDNGNTLWRYAIRFRGRRTGFAERGLSSPAREGKAERSSASSGSKSAEASAKKAMEEF